MFAAYFEKMSKIFSKNEEMKKFSVVRGYRERERERERER